MNGCPGGGVFPFSLISKATRTERIYLMIGSYHRVLTFFLFSAMDSYTVFWNYIPNFTILLVCFFAPHCFTLDIILSRLRSVCFTHQLKSGSWSIFCNTAYSSTPTGYHSFKNNSFSQVLLSSFKSTHIFEPLVKNFIHGLPFIISFWSCNDSARSVFL